MTVSIENTIERLKAGKRAYEKGRKEGYVWAEDGADYATLRLYLDDIGDRTCCGHPSWSTFTMPEAEEIRFRELKDVAESEGTPLDRDTYLAGWIDGVLELWARVAPHIR